MEINLKNMYDDKKATIIITNDGKETRIEKENCTEDEWKVATAFIENMRKLAADAQVVE